MNYTCRPLRFEIHPHAAVQFITLPPHRTVTGHMAAAASSINDSASELAMYVRSSSSSPARFRSHLVRLEAVPNLLTVTISMHKVNLRCRSDKDDCGS